MNSHTRAWITLVMILTLFSNVKSSKAEREPELITKIDETLNNAFEAITRAEEKGAKINELITELNKAYSLFQELTSALREGDSEKATIITQECERMTYKITEAANDLESFAIVIIKKYIERRNLTNISATIVVIISSLFLWTRFKRIYTRQALEMKPTVIEDEPQ